MVLGRRLFFQNARKAIAGFLSIGLLVGALGGCASAQSSDAAPSAPPLIAIGDLHGSYEGYENLLREAGLINNRGRWVGGDTILVQVGDVSDRGPDSLAIIRHLQKIKRQAARKGGKVITLVGNHEAMNVTGDLRYVHPGEYEAFEDRSSKNLRDRVYEANRENIEAAYLERDPALTPEAIKDQWMAQTPLGMIEHQQAWRPGGEIGEWVAGNPAIAIVGDNLFVHAGISEKYAAYSVAEINTMTAAALSTGDVSPNSIINDELGPLWYRGLIRRDEAAANVSNEDDDSIAAADQTLSRLSIEDEINLVLETYKVSRIVVGHTPSLTGIAAANNYKLIRIDTGISPYYGGTQSFLRIENGAIYAYDNGVVTELGATP